MKLPIVAGPLRGRWWWSTSPGKLLRVLGGSYEPEQTGAFERALRPGDSFLDVGAHAGYYTLLASMLVGDSGRVWAFEPNPRNFGYLERNVEINGRANVECVPAAVSRGTGVARFAMAGSGTGHLSAAGALEVRTLSLDGFCAERALRPAAVKVDVEGAELEVLEGAAELLREARPTIFLSTHGPELHRAALARLEEAGYEARPLVGEALESATEVVAVPRAR